MATPRLAVISFVLAVLLGSFVTSKSNSGTWFINPSGTGDAPTIQAGIDSAVAGDTVSLANGTFAGDGNRDIDFLGKAITIRSQSGDPDSCIIDCQGSQANPHRGFYIHLGEDSTSVLEGVTITNGWLEGIFGLWERGAGVYCEGSSPKFVNCKFTRNEGVYVWGVGMCCDTSSSPILIDCLFFDNGNGISSNVSGGGLMCIESSSPTLTNCTFSADSADSGGGMYCAGGSPILTGCTFSDNSIGAVECMNSSPTFTNCTFTNNSAPTGGGIRCQGPPSPTLINCTFSGNSASDSGGGMQCVSSSPVLTNCIFVGNSAGSGGALTSLDESPTLTNCTLFGNSATVFGGVMMVLAGAVLENTIIAFSTAGEAVFGTATLTCCDLYGNAGGDWVGEIAGQYGTNGNISMDPVFCDAGNGNLYLASDSPCLGGTCIQIGAFGAGCVGAVPEIFLVSDVGNDQGRQVRIKWYRSLYDSPVHAVDITGYGIYRRQDQYLRTSGAEPAQPTASAAPSRTPQLDGWDYLSTIPAHGDSIYQYVAPTLCDSTAEGGICWSSFFIRAMTPDPFAYYDSPEDSGYSVDNLAPAAPAAFSVVYNAGSNLLAWDPSEDEDFYYFTIYRSDNPDLLLDPPVNTDWSAIHSTIETTWLDTSPDAWRYRYRITAVDHAGNESDPAYASTVTGTVNREIPKSYVLYQNVPNPFNPSTVIAYDIPSNGKVSLEIFDVTGRLVTTLVDGEQTAGSKTATWDGKDANGDPAGSGVYFYRLTAGEKVITNKMVLLK